MVRVAKKTQRIPQQEISVQHQRIPVFRTAISSKPHSKVAGGLSSAEGGKTTTEDS